MAPGDDVWSDPLLGTDRPAADDVWTALLDALVEGRARGFLGPGSVDDAVGHARGFVGPVAEATTILDLGSGGGLPGFVVAAARPDAQVTLLDSSQTRTDWLRRVVARLGWGDRVRVVLARAEVLGHETAWRSTQQAVVARGFAPPLVTAECAAAFLVVGGRLVVSEPPGGRPQRWPRGELAELGLEAIAWRDPAVAVFTQVAPCPELVPRRKVVRGRTS